MAGCFYLLLICDLLLQAAQQFGGMLTALKAPCKLDFGKGLSLLLRYLSPHLHTQMAKYIICSRKVFLLLLLHWFQNLLFGFSSMLTQKYIFLPCFILGGC